MNAATPAHRAHIAYLDDDSDYAALLRYSLQRLGHHVDTFELTEQALEALAARDYDAFITDYNMPLVSGITAIARARRARPRLPCALISNHIADLDHLTAIEGVMVRRKPQSQAEFAALAGELLPAA